MNWLLFIVGCFAVFRLSLLLSSEDGPAFIFRKLRRLPPEKSSLKKGMSCILCVSVWFGSLVSAYYVWCGWITLAQSAPYGLALSGGAICLHMTFTKGI